MCHCRYLIEKDIVDRDAVAPPQLAADAPVLDVFKPHVVDLFKPLWHDLDVPVLHSLCREVHSTSYEAFGDYCLIKFSGRFRGTTSRWQLGICISVRLSAVPLAEYEQNVTGCLAKSATQCCCETACAESAEEARHLHNARDRL